MGNTFNYNDFLAETKAKNTKNVDFNKQMFDVGNLDRNTTNDLNNIDNPKNVGHSYINENYYKQNESYNDLANKVNDYSFSKTFDNTMSRNANTGIESNKAINAATKQSKGSVNALVPELMSKISENVDETIDNVSSFFQNRIDGMTNKEILNYAKISDALAQKGELDTQRETDLLKAWSINKEMEYSLEGLGIEKDAMESQQFFQKIQTAVSAVSTVIAAVALFI